ncbi:MAG: 16S rRNA (cytosine(967)-C(5))-methyltransferase RsmB [Gammaproteobacteria bacterium]|nr:16S rRNA (cytosine(967)-C(5))-methyltransferase RsmB [Gammaproteobacteria bacterium]MDH3804871.1 16S rRNA (cytosine(967)-C(5))-methyltransferase RsmB [Gammaproteobacteria bacterium]
MSDIKKGARLRATAAEIVDAVAAGGRSLDAALLQREDRIAADDRPLLRLLCFGALRHHWRLQSWVDALLDRPLKSRDSVVNALLAIGLYQLSDTRIPDHAVVSQTVEATRFLRRPKLAPLVNAILRRALRDRIFDEAPSNEMAAHDHPQWILDVLQADWPNDWSDIVAANNARAPMWLRVNSLHGTAADYVGRLEAEGIDSELLPAAPQAVRLAEPRPVDSLPGFAAGHVSVQDAAAQLAAPWLIGGVDGRVLDACAAPGGKSGHLLELGSGRIVLTCLDKDAARLEGVSANLDRLGLDATLLAADASKPNEWWDGLPFDAVLLDAPCSASGVIRRHPDIKLLRRPTDLDGLARLQSGLLDALWPLVARGGRLLYVTCSVFAAENEAVAARFLRDNDDVREDDLLQNNNIRDLMRHKACGHQILPGTAELDGFYYAGFVKVS